MCIDRRAMRSVAAHKGWATRRARVQQLDQSDADPFEVGGTCMTREARVPNALPPFDSSDPMSGMDSVRRSPRDLDKG